MASHCHLSLLMLGAALCGLFAVSVFAGESDCGAGVEQIDRGERRMLLLCSASLSADSELTGLDKAGIQLFYRQDLRRCSPTDRRPGLFLGIEASATARDTRLRVLDSESGGVQCDLALEVPSRRLLTAQSLQATEFADIYELSIVTDNGLDLSGACAAGPEFVGSRGPLMELLQTECLPDTLRARVRLTPGPQQPAKLVFTARDQRGQPVPAISLIGPPPPFFAGDMAEADARFIDVDGVRTRYFEAGQGEVLLLVHGGQPSSADYNALQWQQNFAGFARDFRVIALDRIGQGRSANPAHLDDYARYYSLVVEHLLGFMNALGLEQAHLVGHSQGGWPVTRIAVDHPDRVASLVVVDSTMIAPAGNAGQAVRFYVYLQKDLHPQGGETPESIRRGMEMFTYTNNNITQERVERILALSHRPEYADAQAWFAKSSMSPAHPSFRKLKAELWSELATGRLRVPTLIIWGRQDPEGSFEAGRRMAEQMRAAGSPVSFHAFEAAGHVPYMEYPREFNRVVTEFARGTTVPINPAPEPDRAGATVDRGDERAVTGR